MKRCLILETGHVFIGEAIGADREQFGEVVFNTGMTGYQEILSDPSYCGQIVTMTYPLIGNYGVNRDDFESISPSISGLIIKETTEHPSHWKSEQSLHAMLKEKGVPGLVGIDTRKLTRVIRQHGTVKGAFCHPDKNQEEVLNTLKKKTLPSDQVSRVSTTASYVSPGAGPRVVIVDFGMKKGILRDVIKLGCDVIVVPYHTPAESILRYGPDGVLLTNGPGDPKDVPEAVAMVRDLLGKTPIFGICLGHQLLALACGANTIKMKFGHRGANHPVKDLTTGKFYITSQNHGYTVDPESLVNTGLEMTHIAINDGTVEGLRHQIHPAFSVQFHPEATPGPIDSAHLFDRFLTAMKTFRKETVQHA